MSDLETQYSIWIEAPAYGDAAFYAEWLRAAKEANDILQQLMEDQNSKPHLQDIFMQSVPDFAWTACFFMRQIHEESSMFVVPWRDEIPELFCCLQSLGFFRLLGSRYRMTIPSLRMTSAHVEDALLRLAATIDSDYMLHPEVLVVRHDKTSIES